MREELRECPFCGAPGAKAVPGGGYWKIKCDCGITVSGYATRKNAVNAWNRRPNENETDTKVINCLDCGHSVEIKIVPGCLDHPVIYQPSVEAKNTVREF